ncbi:RICIN domain-containing protein, partial [Streptomyces sp. NPDC056756]|uniref:RICIN domain-containing protein n=1 Tax=Streptomyces sp. NPDC056756 TaxID=3345938 RepID=UPI00368858F7
MTGTSAPEGVYRIRNAASGLLLQVEGGNRVRVGPDGEPAAARQWEITAVHSGGGIFHVVSVDNGRRLDVANASTESGTRVQVWRANAFGAQEWGGGGPPRPPPGGWQLAPHNGRAPGGGAPGGGPAVGGPHTPPH